MPRSDTDWFITGRLGSLSLLTETTEPGHKRKKIGSYIRSVNELRHSYQAFYAAKWIPNDSLELSEASNESSRDDIMTDGNDTILILPSYAVIAASPSSLVSLPFSKHENPNIPSLTASDSSGNSHSFSINTTSLNYETGINCNNTHVKVDVNGWLYSNHKGLLTKRQRVVLGLIRRLVGVQTTNTLRPSPGISPDSANSSPVSSSSSSAKLKLNLPDNGVTLNDIALFTDCLNSTEPSGKNVAKLGEVNSWSIPDDDFATNNANLIMRLAPFLGTPKPNTPISVHFYNDKFSRSEIIQSSVTGYFSLRVNLDFVPSHVRVIACDGLSAISNIQPVPITGISLISDIDDTVKLTNILDGPRTVVRNIFIREAEQLVLNGVGEWYRRLYQRGVKFHYVSNSPWQLYPTLAKFFEKAKLPPGSVHLKQYSGMLQGIFEPVNERKKSSLSRIFSDFPQRKFILVGDSGEADLEAYTEIALENHSQVLAILIRDVGNYSDGPYINSPTRNRNSSTSSSSSSGSSYLGGVSDSVPFKDHSHLSSKSERVCNDISDLSDGFLLYKNLPPPLPPRNPIRTNSKPPLPEKPRHLKGKVVVPEHQNYSSALSKETEIDVPVVAKSGLSDSSAVLKSDVTTSSGVVSKNISRCKVSPPNIIPIPYRVNDKNEKLTDSPGILNSSESINLVNPNPSPISNKVSRNLSPCRSMFLEFASSSSVLSRTNRDSTKSTLTAQSSKPVAGGLTSGLSDLVPLQLSKVNTLNISSTVNKREAIWRQRWARAERLLRGKGPGLFIWRTGEDGESICASIVDDFINETG